MATKVWVPRWKLKAVVSEESSDVATKGTELKLEPVVSEESSSFDENMATKGTKLKLEPVVSEESSSFDENMATKGTELKLEPVVSEESSSFDENMATKGTKLKLEPVVSEESSSFEENMATKGTKLKLEPVVSEESSSFDENMATKGTKLKLDPVVSDEGSDDGDDDDGRESENEELGLALDKLNLGPKKKLLVICLGGLLVHRVHKFNSPSHLRHRRADYVRGNFLIFMRPFCHVFLKFCFERFEVALWSSAREHNVEPLLDYLMRGLQRKLLFIWDQEECTDSGFSCLEKSEKPIFLKELTKVWEKKWPCGKFSAANTLLIDNDPYKGQLNPPYTGIYPDQYNVENKFNDQFLAPKGVLQEYLDGVVDAEDVPTYVKNHTFGQQELTSGITTRRLLQLLAKPKVVDNPLKKHP